MLKRRCQLQLACIFRCEVTEVEPSHARDAGLGLRPLQIERLHLRVDAGPRRDLQERETYLAVGRSEQELLRRFPQEEDASWHLARVQGR